MKIDVDQYLDVLDYLNEINRKEFEDLDLTDFFENPPDRDKKIEIKEKFTKLNNYNRIYVLVAYENMRDEFGLILKEKNNQNPDENKK